MKFHLSLLFFFACSQVHALSCQQPSLKLGADVLKELSDNPINCQNNSVHLTFDDGPNAQVTPALLKELKARNVKATFFVSTTNLEAANRNHDTNLALVNETMNAGHLIASHGHEHNAYDLRMDGKGEVLEKGFTDQEKEQQIARSVQLLNYATQNRFSNQKTMLFRFPYGRGAMPSAAELKRMDQQGIMRFQSTNYAGQLAEYRRQSAPLQVLASNGFSHLGWNHDSGDSSFGMGMPNADALKGYVLKNLKAMCSGNSTQVALFHDIKVMNTVAIPVIIDIGRCLGLKFISPNEMMANKTSLVERGVLIQKSQTQRAPADTLGELIATVTKAGSPNPECPPEKDQTCYSEQYKRRYQECEGGASICLGGRWYSRQDPMILLNCNLKD
ncbi:polysaccharide deacetylase family protein [Peredibacter starrii]|uniref:Polysaccharide deacetylase family protein n=1 Tax=Peredibacter starrii TaxID=28202 RepID=A0AAX4HT81_9BACT|nr:polysaccharide deacetylase family protein [Peredibacter starrii]WPU66383.1 polysaccharide deacetylase family protein [Peredibacter starrii]